MAADGAGSPPRKGASSVPFPGRQASAGGCTWTARSGFDTWAKDGDSVYNMKMQVKTEARWWFNKHAYQFPTGQMFERLLRETGAYKPAISKDVGSGPRYCVQIHLPTLMSFLKTNMPGFTEPAEGCGEDRVLPMSSVPEFF